MSRRARLLAGLSLLAVAVLALDHPALAAVVLVAAGLAALALAVPWRRRATQGPAKAELIPGRIERILVPVDFSPESARALEYARMLAGRFHSQVFVLYVVPAPRGLSGRRSTEEAQEIRWRARVGMQAFLRACGGNAGCQVVFATGTPFAAILDEARRLRADLIVLGPRGAGGTDASVLGRTAAEVVRRANVPVFTVTGLTETAASGDGSAVAAAA